MVKKKLLYILWSAVIVGIILVLVNFVDIILNEYKHSPSQRRVQWACMSIAHAMHRDIDIKQSLSSPRSHIFLAGSAQYLRELESGSRRGGILVIGKDVVDGEYEKYICGQIVQQENDKLIVTLFVMSPGEDGVWSEYLAEFILTFYQQTPSEQIKSLYKSALSHRMGDDAMAGAKISIKNMEEDDE